MSLVKLYPEMMAHLPNFRFIEEYHPEQTTICAPYAYVADTVIEVMTNIDIDEARGSGLSNEAWAAMTELRDKLAAEAKLGWYVVNCADDQRRYVFSICKVYKDVIAAPRICCLSKLERAYIAAFLCVKELPKWDPRPGSFMCR